MIFYKMEAIITNEEYVEKLQDRRTVNSINHAIGVKTDEFNKKLKGGSIFVAEIYDELFTAAAVVEKKKNIGKLTEEFCKSIEVEVDQVTVDEITIMDFKNYAERASRNGLIRDSEDIIEEYNLERLNGRGFRGTDFGENMLEVKERKTIASLAEKNLVSETLMPEIERIYAGKVMPKVKGHPVHYIVKTDSREIRNTTYRSLLSALYENKRIDCKRYSFLDFRPGTCGISEMTYDALYKCSKGGVIVARYFGDDGSDDEYASDEQETLRMIADAMQRYRNEVLTVVCFPRECTKARDTLLEYLGTVSVIEIEEEYAKNDRAKGYLRNLAKEKHINADIKLLNKIEEDKVYLSGDLKNIFDTWYDERLKQEVFPQYKTCVTAKHEVAKQKPKGSAYDELMEMVGLDNAKATIQKALNFYKMQKLYSDRGISTERPAMHMVFTGNPGTAKTTVARLFARVMKENGLLSKGNLIEVNRSDLVARYVGHSAINVKEKFQAALGSVLFIDEAYSLVDDRHGSFGDEVITTIVSEMENHRDELVVIFAGYPDKMEEFISRNEGLKSRIAFHVPFEDYDSKELSEISELMCKHLGVKLSEDAKDKLSEIFSEVVKEEDWGNGRYVRNVLELARMNQAGRILEMDVDKVTDEDLCTLTADDIEAPILEHNPNECKSIGFCA